MKLKRCNVIKYKSNTYLMEFSCKLKKGGLLVLRFFKILRINIKKNKISKLYKMQKVFKEKYNVGDFLKTQQFLSICLFDSFS